MTEEHIYRRECGRWLVHRTAYSSARQGEAPIRLVRRASNGMVLDPLGYEMTEGEARGLAAALLEASSPLQLQLMTEADRG